ncbi:UNVERIFIED_CONTAM: hypothetical protein GTU68_038249 [Idotea baltica]|nr:hypothetical protein [Idotea baltica]
MSTAFAEDAKQAPPPIPVLIVEVKGESEVVNQDLPGRISAYRTAEVRARVAGIIEKRVFVEGSNVKAGDVLFKIEGRSLKATYRARKADVANAVAVSNLAKQTLKRYEKLLKLGAQSLAQVEQARANLQIAKINLDYTTVTAPISGRIDKALVTEGALTAAGSTQLASIEQIDKVYVDFTRSNSDVNRLRQARKAGRLTDAKDTNLEISFDDGTIYPEKGQLEFTSMSVDRETGSTSLRAVVNNPDSVLLPGMFVRVKAPVATTNNIIKVPQKSVSITPTGAEVFLIKDGNLVPVKITLGPMTEDNWFVRSGLNSGDKVVISDTTILKSIPGAKFVGMTIEQMKAAGVTPPKPKADSETSSKTDGETKQKAKN